MGTGSTRGSVPGVWRVRVRVNTLQTRSKLCTWAGRPMGVSILSRSSFDALADTGEAANASNQWGYSEIAAWLTYQLQWSVKNKVNINSIGILDGLEDAEPSAGYQRVIRTVYGLGLPRVQVSSWHPQVDPCQTLAPRAEVVGNLTPLRHGRHKWGYSNIVEHSDVKVRFKNRFEPESNRTEHDVQVQQLLISEPEHRVRVWGSPKRVAFELSSNTERKIHQSPIKYGDFDTKLVPCGLDPRKTFPSLECSAMVDHFAAVDHQLQSNDGPSVIMEYLVQGARSGSRFSNFRTRGSGSGFTENAPNLN
ncbi:hypothetical protein R3P38DRAFT_2799620 [Favolaschia claudopus]|uniref:Uncharacterized protein n=1 Tax=Favolaschia claudopus TaxID=2862362 RepID=A0AAV9ZZV4_9AGAR